MAIYEDQLQQLAASSAAQPTFITNLPDMRKGADIYIEPPPQAAAPTLASSIPQGQRSILDDFEKRIAEAPSYLEKQRLINQLADDAQQRLGKAQSAVLQVAEQSLNLQPERTRLQGLMTSDARDRKLNGTDSE